MFKFQPIKQAESYPGYSAIVHSCKIYDKSVETFNESLSYAEQEKGHTLGAKNFFEAIKQGCKSFKDFKQKIIKDQVSVLITTFNEKDTEKYESVNIFGGDNKAEAFPEAPTNDQFYFNKDLLSDEQVSQRNFYHITLNDYH